MVLQPLVICFTHQWYNSFGVADPGGLFRSSVVQQGKKSLCRLFCGVAAAGDLFHSSVVQQ